MRTPRLKELAAAIEEKFPDLIATIERGYCNTDRNPAGVSWRIAGKGRWGNRLIVRERATGTVVLDHNSAETYRYNEQVVDWIRDRERDRT